MQWKQYLYQKPLQVLLIVFCLLVVKEIIYTTTFHGEPSPIADGYSEANTIRGATSFIDNGITHFYGLPDTCYGGILPGRGRMGLSEKLGVSCEGKAYTHYPPGPEYMGWFGMKIVGSKNWTLLRLLPITLSVFVGYFFITTMFNLVGGGIKGLIFGLMLILPPMYTNYLHGLHHQQYAFIMLQLQMCLCIKYFLDAKWRNWKTGVAFALLGFAQGWMTFDFAFLATLFAIPFYLIFRKERAVKFITFVTVGLLSGIPYIISHLLHFYQVVLYTGDVKLALQDFTGAASVRANNSGSAHAMPSPKYDPKLIGPLTVAKDFLYRVAGRGKYLSINLINFIWIILGLKFIKQIEFKKGYKFEFQITGDDILALASSVVVASLWSIVMKQHAHIHGFIARHYFFCYFFCCYILVNRTKRLQ